MQAKPEDVLHSSSKGSFLSSDETDIFDYEELEELKSIKKVYWETICTLVDVQKKIEAQNRVYYTIIEAQVEKLKKLNDEKNHYKVHCNQFYQESLYANEELNRNIKRSNNIIFGLHNQNAYNPGENMEAEINGSPDFENVNNIILEQDILPETEKTGNNHSGWREKIKNERNNCKEPNIRSV